VTKSPSNHGVRPDIQALRALAILSVVIYHIWPDRLTGGFVGVDIFFVISGYLITGQLWRQEQKTGKVDFADFWSRRARRLLPASLLVILATTLATYLFSTPSWFIKVHDESYGATVYAQNWVLIGKVTNYLTDDGTKSPFQHFWSLSVEEQYYIFWPIVLFLALLLAKIFKRLRNRYVLLTILFAVLVGSLTYSIYLTWDSPSAAYFDTFTRAWEFAAGALLAIGTSSEDQVAKNRSPIWFWAGVALVTYTLATFTGATPFPSYWAALPVLATVLMLHGGQSASALMPAKVLAWRPIQFIGDISYSMYLWHWPILILAPWVLVGNPDIWARFAIFGLAIVLGRLSKRFVEDPVRFGWLSTLRPGRQLMAAGLGMLIVLSSTFGLEAMAKTQLKNSFGNTQLTPPLSNLNNGAKAKDSGDCKVGRSEDRFFTCQKGDPNGKIRVALIGDSHTRQWFVPVDDLAYKYHWNLTMISKSACTVLDPALYPDGYTDKTCKGWNQNLEAYLAKTKPFDLVINSNSSLVTQGRSDVAKAFASEVAKITAKGTKFFLIHDTPKPKQNFIPCIEQFGAKAASACALPRSAGLTPADPLPAAVKGHANVVVADFTNLFCSQTSCPPVKGNIIVYRDNSHITTTWAKHLEPALDAKIPAEFKK
jgi:peptidoglycan/LPS O-acetylase OafA/YrhL